MIMFGMGTQMNVRDFLNVASMPVGVIVGVGCQFLMMPLLGFTLASIFRFPPEIGAGLILIGSCSSGLSSNVMTFLAKGNLALSVTLTAIATAAAPIMTPLWMRFLAGSMVSATCLVWLAVYGWGWMVSLLEDPNSVRALSLMSLPGFVAGAVVFGCIYHVATKLRPGIAKWMPRVSMFGIVCFTLVATAQGHDQLLAVGLTLLIAVTLHNPLGIVLGYGISRALGLNEQDARTVAIEVGSSTI